MARLQGSAPRGPQESPTHVDLKPEPEAQCLILEALPHHVLMEVLRHLDQDSLCFLAQTCRTFLHLCGTPSLWPRRRVGGSLVRAVRCSLSSVLHVPPQVFNVRVEEGRSAKFPLSVPLHNLRFVLGASDVDGLAERASGLVQDLIASAPAAATYHPASASMPSARPPPSQPQLQLHETSTAMSPPGGQLGDPVGIQGGGDAADGRGGRLLRPSAALAMCRADRGFVRLGLRPGVAVAHVLLEAPTLTYLPAPASPQLTTDQPIVEPESASEEGTALREVHSAPSAAQDLLALLLPLPAPLAAGCSCCPDGHGSSNNRVSHSGGGACGGGGSSGGGRFGAGGGVGDVLLPAAVASGAAVGAADAAAVAAVAAVEAAQLRLLERAVAGVPGAREAWRAFAAGCHQVAAARLRLVAATTAAPAGDGSGGPRAPCPQPQSLLHLEPDADVALNPDGVEAGSGVVAAGAGAGDEESTAAAGVADGVDRKIAGEGEGAAPPLAPAVTVTGAPSRGQQLHQPSQLWHRYRLLGPGQQWQPQAPTDPAASCASTSSSTSCPAVSRLAAHCPGPEPAALYRLCVCMRLRLLGLMTLGARSSSGNSAGAGGGGGHPPAQRPGGSGGSGAAPPADLAQALEASRAITLLFGRLLASVVAARHGFMEQAAAAGAAAAAAEGGAAPAAAGGATHATCGSSARGPRGSGSWIATAAGAALDAAAAASSSSDANLCLTTSEALMELREEVAAAAAPTWTVAAGVDRAAAAVGSAQARMMEQAASSRGKEAVAVGLAARDSRTDGPRDDVRQARDVRDAGVGGDVGGAARWNAGAAGELVRKLCLLLSGCLTPAGARLLTTPTRYSPLGVALAAMADASDGGGWGSLGPVAAAPRMGAYLLRAASCGGAERAAALDAAEAREALRGLLLSYMLRQVTWALYCLGVL